MIQGALEADGRIAAKNAVKVRAALRELADYKQLFLQYQNTHPVSTDNLAKDRARARAWAIMNVTQLRTEALASVLWRMWAEAWVLGDVAAGEWIQRTQELNKADDGYVDWSKWQPGDRAAAIMLKRPKAFQQILDKTNASIKGMTNTSITDIGNALADAVELGLDAERAAVLIGRHVASPARALTIAITEQNRVMSAATINRYKEAELEKMEWHVSDPCDKCAQNANVEVVIGTSFPSGNTQPPAHPHCRCVLLPVIPGMNEEPGIEQGNITAPVVTPGGAIEHQPMKPQQTEAPTTWTPMSPERWVERRQAERVTKGYPPYTGKQLQILEDQANDATAMWERGPHVIRWDKSSTKIDQPHVDAFMANFDLAISKLPEWRRFDEDGIERGYAAVLSSEAAGNTLAYTYLGNNTIWFSNTTIMKSLDAPAIDLGLPVDKYKMPAQYTNNANLYTIAHELGHTVDSHVNNGFRGRFTAPLRRKFADLWSGYSRKDPDEAYAEVFAQWLIGEHNALTDIYAKKFGWNLTAQEYREQIAEKWVGNSRNQNIGG